MNQLIIDFLASIASHIPLEYDRYTEEDGNYNIFGWLKRSDGKRDFVLFNLSVENDELKGGFVTSSSKYSKQIHELMFDTKEGHVDCKKVPEIIN